MPLSPDWSKLAFNNGWTRLFSLRSVVRGGMLVLKLAIGVLVAFAFLRSNRTWLLEITQQNLQGTVLETWSASLLLMLVLGGGAMSLGAIDYVYQRWQHEKASRCPSRIYVRKRAERRRSAEQSENEMHAAGDAVVANAAKSSEPPVVLTNPTHLAVAIRYERETMAAPRVVAKGEGHSRVHRSYRATTVFPCWNESRLPECSTPLSGWTKKFHPSLTVRSQRSSHTSSPQTVGVDDHRPSHCGDPRPSHRFVRPADLSRAIEHDGSP